MNQLDLNGTCTYADYLLWKFKDIVCVRNNQFAYKGAYFEGDTMISVVFPNVKIYIADVFDIYNGLKIRDL